MCKAYPGPRCTNHARKQLLAAQEQLKTEEATGERNEALMKARKKYADALIAWETTPGGQKGLKDAIASIQEQITVLQNNDDYMSKEKQNESSALRDKSRSLGYRLNKGKELRKKQNTLYDFYQRHEKGERFPLHERWEKYQTLDSSWETSNGDEIRVYNMYPAYRKQDYSKCAWRIRDGEPVAMIRFYDKNNNGHGDIAVLCDIEVSPFYRGEGLGVGTIKELDDKYTRLHTSGSYSTSGHRSLSAHVPLYRGAQEQISPNVTHYEFVDWQQGDIISS